MAGQIILLHGASSVGKSTLARQLQNTLERPYWHISIDHLRDHQVLPMHRYQSGEFDWHQDRQCIFSAFHASVGAYARSGINLILEHIIDTGGWMDELVRLFHDSDVLFVGLHCDFNILKDRERMRGDRALGSAQTDMLRIHRDRIYDLELDTTDDPKANVNAILASLHSGVRISEFS